MVNLHDSDYKYFPAVFLFMCYDRSVVSVMIEMLYILMHYFLTRISDI